MEGWSALQATGEPNITGYGDNNSAWASSAVGSATEWLRLHYELTVYATQVRVHESWNNGFIYQVDLIDSAGASHTIWSGTDTTPKQANAWFDISFTQTSYQVNGVKIYTQSSYREEVDAVELIGYLPVTGSTSLWASSASASSNYSICTPTKATSAPDLEGCR